MSRYACHDCREAIPNGMAVIRSESLQEVARCGHCYGVKYLGYLPRNHKSSRKFFHVGG